MDNKKKLDKQNVEDVIALAPMQQGMLFQYITNKDSEQYFEQLSLRLSGRIDASYIKAAWSFVIKTNEMLRTVYRWEAIEKPLQIILKEIEVPVRTHDLSQNKTGDKKDIEQLIEEIRENDRKEKIDISLEPFRVTLCKINENEYEMIVSNHHILYDGWSNGILLKEFTEAYISICSGKEPERVTKNKYKEFIKWNLKQDKNKQEKFWRDFLADFDTKTLLPEDNKKTEGASRAKNFVCSIPKAAAVKIADFTRKQSVTLATLIYTAWGVLLQRYGNLEDVVFGTTVSGRIPEIKGINNMVGLFINTLPLRVKANASEKLSDLLAGVDELLKLREEYESTPLADIRAYSEFSGTESLFDSIVVMENYPLDSQLNNGNEILNIKACEIFEMTNFKLTLVIAESDGGIDLKFSYNGEAFESATISRLAKHLINIINDMVSDPQKELGSIEMLDEEEKKKLLFDFNNTQADYPKDKSVNMLFEEQAEKTPDSIALVFKDRSMTYRELNSKANQLARYLRKEGVGKNTIVGFMVERSFEMIIGIMAILKAGGAYLPIDPDYPEHRVNYLLNSSKTALLLTLSKTANKLSHVASKVIAIDEVIKDCTFPTDNLNIEYDPEQLMYVLYTSGSTGNPKGAMIKSHAFVNLLNWFTTEFDINEDSRVLLIAPISFDLAQKNLYSSLIKGGRLYLFSPGIFDYNIMSEVIEKGGIDTVNCSPSAFYPLIDFNESSEYRRLKPLKKVFLGGEAINLSKMLPWVKSSNYNGEIMNTYGPTECTDISSFYRVDNSRLEEYTTVPVGRPINNFKIYIADRNLNPVPVGIAGELCVGGIGLAYGYYNEPELTSEKFVSLPAVPGERIYRTGDLARWMPDGNIEFMGRVDHQVKVRGFRIELGEIEAGLLLHEEVKEAVVIDRLDSRGNKYLCAYIVAKDNFNVQNLRGYLSTILPDYMVPSYFTKMEKLPLTPNGKINRKALPDTVENRDTRAEIKEPSSEIEKNLVKIWQKILNTENISVNDKFFDIGGNSILVIQMHGLIEKQYPGKVTVTDLFSYPTIVKLAEFIEGGREATTEPAAAADNAGLQQETESGKEIAVIGISAKLPLADSAEEFWENLRNSVDCVRGVPKTREKDVEGYLRAMGIEPDSVERVEAAYLDEIDKFDYKYFKLSPKEAALMDPNQRLFLETAWSAIEDSGYGGKKLVGSRTGVYLGFGSDPDYKRLISILEPASMSMALAGNVRPIIASRLSYLMDFRGPSVTVDTTCSSSLVAAHLACQSIRNGECELAVAGGVQLHMMPVRQTKVGVESSTARTKAFDDSSDGTGTGEGVIAIVLKPLSKALKDRDSVYAVIKGSAMNQDGLSIGITAPNAAAQEDVIVNAWKAAGVSPETITYIEAHGTGTKLGDPIEIDGMTRAFRKYTDKKQFCAVGSVKSNIGHLDNSAGAAGLLKAVLSLKNRQIPESLHFSVPNRKINFEASPVYVNNRLTEWETAGIPRRCGVSAFGLSGTNCHIVLEEAPVLSEQINNTAETNAYKLNVLTISAKNQNVLKKLVENYRLYLDKEAGLLPSDICYTANTGRGQYNSRLAIIFKDIEELKGRLETLSRNGFSDINEEKIFFGEHKVVSSAKASGEYGEVTEEQIRENSKKAELKADEFTASGSSNENILSELCSIYIKGADIDWNRLYIGESPKVLHLPVYPFEKIRCWIEGKPVKTVKAAKETGLPLLDTHLVESLELDIYNTYFSADRHWMLNEHRIMGECILVGTTYLEIAIEACKKYFGDKAVEIRDVTFLSTMAVRPGEERETQTILKKRNSYYEFTVISRLRGDEQNQWSRHVEGKICAAPEYQVQKVDIGQLKSKYSAGYFVPDIDSYNSQSAFEFGPRWKNISEMYVGDEELLSHIKMPEQFVKELDKYTIYPSVLDNALATMPLLDKALNSRPFSGENGIFLPFSYKAIRIYKPLPAEFYSYVKLKSELTDKASRVTFDIALADKSGEIFADIEAYSLKKAEKTKISGIKSDIYYNLEWIPVQLEKTVVRPSGGSVLIFNDKSGLGDELVKQLKNNGREVMKVQNGKKYEFVQDGIYTVGADEIDYVSLLEQMKNKNITQIIHLFALDNKKVTNINEFDESQKNGINSVFKLTRAILKNNLKENIDIVLLAENADEVSQKESELKPENSTMFGMAKVIGEEYKNLKCRCIDIDKGTKTQELLEELIWGADTAKVAYREGSRYEQEIRPLDIESLPDTGFKLSENGVYIITGGTGGIGIETAKHLASIAKIKLALINRSEFPAREQWESILSDGENNKLCNRIKAIREIEKAGSTVICCKADVSCEEDIRPLTESLRNSFGRINGVIHSAGVAGDGFLVKKEEKAFDEVMNPKTRGTWLLAELTEQDNTDFFVMFSSNNTLLGMPGQGDYTAANTFLGAFSSYRNKQCRSTVTINWPAWKETGMAADHGANVDSIFKVLPTSLAMVALDNILAKAPQKVVVGELNYGGTINGKTIADVDLRLSESIRSRIEKHQKALEPKAGSAESTVQQEIKLTGKKTGAYTKTEIKVALIWKEVLGFDEFNIYDDFFDLGGDSIMITKVKTLIDEAYGNVASVADIFDYTTISDLAEYINPDDEDFKVSASSSSTTAEDNSDTALNDSRSDTAEESSSSETDIEKDINSLLDELEKGSMDIDKALEKFTKL